MNRKKTVGILILFAVALIWGSSFVSQDKAMEYIGPYAFLGLRSVLSCIALAAVSLVTGIVKKKGGEAILSPEEKKKERKTLLCGGIACGCCLFVASLFQQIGVVYTDAGKAGFITSLYIILVPIIGIFMKKRPPFLVWIAVVTAVPGMYLLCVKEGFSVGKGDILVAVCAVFFALHIIVAGIFAPRTDCVKLSCIQFAVCAVFGLISTCVFEPETSFESIKQAFWLIAYSGVMSGAVGYTLQFVGQKNVDPTIASLIMSLESVFAVIFAWILLGQKLEIGELIGCILIFAAVVIAQLPEKKNVDKEKNI